MVRRYNSGGIPVVEEVPGLGEGFGNFVQQILQGQEQKKEQADFQDILTWAKGGFEGDIPKMKTQRGRQLGSDLAGQYSLQQQQLAGQKELQQQRIAGQKEIASMKAAKPRTAQQITTEMNSVMTALNKVGVTALTKGVGPKMKTQLKQRLGTLRNDLMNVTGKLARTQQTEPIYQLFEQSIKGATKEGGTITDWNGVYGKKAYTPALQKFIKGAKNYNINPQRAKEIFDDIWGQKYIGDVNNWMSLQDPKIQGEVGQEAAPLVNEDPLGFRVK
jgi:hypothetical protein